MVRASVLLTAAEIDHGERPAGQGGSHGEAGRAGRHHRHAQVIASAAAHRIIKYLVTRSCAAEKY